MSSYLHNLSPQDLWHQQKFVEANLPVLEMAVLMGIPDRAPPMDQETSLEWMRAARELPFLPMPITYATWLLWITCAPAWRNGDLQPSTADLMLLLLQTWSTLFGGNFQLPTPKDEA